MVLWGTDRWRQENGRPVLWCVRYLMGNSYFRPAQSSKPFDTSAHWFEPVGNWENILYAEFASSCDLHLHGRRYSAIMYQKRFFLFINPRTVHVYALLLRVGPYRKLDARSIIIRQLKTASPRVRLFSAVTSARDVRVTIEITWTFQCFS